MVSIAIMLHLLAAVVWVGGMFFAIMVLRLAAGELEASSRVPLWRRVFDNFFPWVWAAVIVLPATGYWLIFEVWGGFSNLPMYLNVMQGVGLIMIAIFLHLWFAPYRRFRQAMAENDLPAAAVQLNQIRILVTVNLCIGLLNIVIGAGGRFA